MDEEINYIGAAIFWTYIIAALVFTTLVLHTLSNMRPARATQENRIRVLTFTALAVVSFTILSFNMLNVLIQSFNMWSRQHQIRIPGDLVSSTWKWSSTSSLFRDFAEAVVMNNVRYLWSQAGLLATFAVCLFMGIEGPRRQIPRLWAFFALSQILPISFTQNLFYVALLCSSDSSARGNISHQRFRLLRYLTMAYCCCLIFLPMASRSAWLMPLVLATRILLFAPFLLSEDKKGSKSGNRSGPTENENTAGLKKLITVPALAPMLVQIYIVLEESLTLSEIGEAVFEHPAVSALGCDLMISLISTVAWLALQRQMGPKIS